MIVTVPSDSLFLLVRISTAPGLRTEGPTTDPEAGGLDNKFIYAKLTFSSLNDRLANTGYSVANYVLPAQVPRSQCNRDWDRAWVRVRLTNAC